MSESNNSTVSIQFPLFYLFTIILVLYIPEVAKERTFPFDGALHLANGIFFKTLFEDLPYVITAPMDWILDYYRQYPALSIRRHPPIFSLVESAMFTVFGASAITGKITVLLFTLFFAVGWFFAIEKLFDEKFIAFFSAILTISLPWSVSLGSIVRFDIPALAFFVWGLYYFSLLCSENSPKRYKYAFLSSIFFVFSLYTYQLAIFGVVASFLYLILKEKLKLLRKPEFYVLSLPIAILVLPLIVFTYIFASDNFLHIFGQKTELMKPFISEHSRLGLKNWLYYFKIMMNSYTVPVIGILIWIISKAKFRLKRVEVLFLLWFFIGYLGFSIIPSKAARYPFHFAIAAIPLTIIGVRDILQALTQRFFSGRHFFKLFLITIAVLFALNIITIDRALEKYAQGYQKVAHYIIANQRASNILYNGSLTGAFIFYVRKYDDNRSFRILRCGLEIVDPEKLIDNMKKNNIGLLVYESEITRKDVEGQKQQSFSDKINSIIRQNDNNFYHLKDFNIIYGKPGKEIAIQLKVYKVQL